MFRCDAVNFKISHSQKRVVHNLNLFINGTAEINHANKSIVPKRNNNSMTVKKWIKTEPATRAMQLVRHILPKDTRIHIIAST